MTALLVSGPALWPDGRIAAMTLRLANGQITSRRAGADPGADLIAPGLIAPGLIDLQLNGGWGHDFTADASTVAAVAARLPATGVTAYLPTIITSPLASYRQRLAELTALGAGQPGSAMVLGVHLEGPYLSPARAGAHDRALLRAADPDEVAAWANHALVRLVTLAPELPGGLAAIGRLRDQGLSVAIGHSDASHDQTLAAIAAGASWGTHLFNAMRPLHHREPGVTGALLTGLIPCGLIADGVHVHPAVVRLAVTALGAHRLCLVSDAMAALGQPPGAYQLGGRAVTVAAGVARLADGTLAGSLLTLDQAVRNMVAWGVERAAALTMASATPARVLGLARKGRLVVGADADLIVLDEALRVTQTIIAGRVAWTRPRPAVAAGQ